MQPTEPTERKWSIEDVFHHLVQSARFHNESDQLLAHDAVVEHFAPKDETPETTDDVADTTTVDGETVPAKVGA